jgi:hypothetical protein
MPRLAQILAVEKGVRKAAKIALTQAHRSTEKPELALGFHKTFRFLDEDETSRVPDEKRRAQFAYRQVFQEVERGLRQLFDVTATKDWANTEAAADVVVDGTTIIMSAPVTYLLFLEKQLDDLHTFVAKVTELPTDQDWTRDENSEFYVANPPETVKTKKVKTFEVIVPPTEHHPAQVGEHTKDEVVGHWQTILYSGAISRTEKADILERIVKLRDAVKYAREEANSTEITNQEVGEALLGYVFGNS